MADAPAPDLVQLATVDITPADFRRTTCAGLSMYESPGPHGSRQMPVWGVALYYTDTKIPRQSKTSSNRGSGGEYLRSIQKK